MIVAIDMNGKVTIFPTFADCPAFNYVLYEAEIQGTMFGLIVRHMTDSRENLIRGPYGTAIEAAARASEYPADQYYTSVCMIKG